MIDCLFHPVAPFGGGGARGAMATPDQAGATPEIFGPMRRGGQEFIDILEVNIIFNH